jgi:glycosyltransferase involved in cell wall biosynthesis
MSVHNDERLLPASIKSILEQTYEKIEFIIIDDASNQKTKEILNIFSSQDERIVVYENRKNIGLTRSLNLGIKISTGKYIARQDSDDISEPNRLKTQLNYLRNHPNVGIVGSWSYIINEENQRIGYSRPPETNCFIKWSLLFDNCVNHPTILMRKSLLSCENLYNENIRYAQDYDFFSRMIKKTEINNLNKYLYNKRVHKNMISLNKNELQTKVRKKIMYRSIEDLMSHEIKRSTIDNLSNVDANNEMKKITEYSQVSILIKNMYNAFINNNMCSEQKQQIILKDAFHRILKPYILSIRQRPLSFSLLILDAVAFYWRNSTNRGKVDILKSVIKF